MNELVAKSPLSLSDSTLLGAKRSTVFTLNSQTGQLLEDAPLASTPLLGAIPDSLTLIRSTQDIQVLSRTGVTLYEASISEIFILPPHTGGEGLFSIRDLKLESNRFLLSKNLNSADLAQRLWKGSLIVGAYNLIRQYN